jgi:leucyl aminopeptidase
MKITVLSKLDPKQEVLALGLFEESKENYNFYNKDLAKDLASAKKDKLFSGKFNETYSTYVSSLAFKKVLIVGLGKKKDLTLERVRRILGKVTNLVKGKKLNGFSTNIAEVCSSTGYLNEEFLGRAVAESLTLTNYAFVKYLSKERKEKKKLLTAVSLQWTKSQTKFGKGLKIGKIIGESSNFVRDLVNEPANVVNSIFLEKVARKIVASSSKLKIKVLNQQEMKKLGMGSLLGVNEGSQNPPKLIIIEYKGASNNNKPTALIGKGITFDSGGYNIKPTRYIEDMKTDMAGSAAVLGTMKIVASLNIKKNLLGVMAICENMISSKAQRPGDIVKAYNGKTIEIGNTDAEGRLVLADALSYIEEKYQPEVMIDLATLTGACVVALGYYAAAIVGKDQKLISTLQEAGEMSGDRVWPLPFYEEYHDAMDGDISDLNNISQKGKGYEGGSITAGVFLSKFVNLEKTRWAHLDIAGSAYWSIKGDYLQKGATGSGVRVLSYYLLDN